MEALQRSATVALRTLLAQQPNTPAKVTFAWRMAAGPALARAGTPRLRDDGVLVIQARDAAWRRELYRAQGVLIERLGELLGPGVVKRIDID